MTRTNLFYAIGKSETELFAYDEYDGHGSGVYYTGDPLMYEHWNVLDEAVKQAKREGLKVYLVEITKKDDGHDITVDLQWDENTDAEELQFKKNLARRLYEEGKHEAALDILRKLPRDDDDVHLLLREMR